MSFRLKYKELVSRYTDASSASKELYYHCCVCGEEANSPLQARCESCSGAIDVFYAYGGIENPETYDTSLERFFPLVPIKDKDNLVPRGEGFTSCLHAKQLGKSLGLENLYLKNEAENPSKSTKDRMAAVGLSFYREQGIKEMAVTSTGNSSTAYALAVQQAGDVKLHVFVGKEFLGRLNYPNHPNIYTYVVDAPFVEAGAMAKRFAKDFGIMAEPGFFSLARREGLKLAYLEAFEEMPEEPEYVFQAISSGMGLLGAYKGAIEYQALGKLERMPRFIGVQQDSCSPMADAFSEKAPGIKSHHVVPHPTGLAAAILRGDPTQTYPYMRAITIDTGGKIMSVTSEEMREAQIRLYEYEGLEVCYAAAASFAALVKMARAEEIDAKAPVLVNLTGGIRSTDVVPTSVTYYEEPRKELAA